MGIEPLPVKVKVQWCHDGEPQTEPFVKAAGESDDDFADRVGSQVTLMLKRRRPTNDCEPPFP